MSPQLLSLAADLVLVVHGLFILFVVGGASLVYRWWFLAWIHLPAAIWGAYVELSGSICPLTPLENYLRRLAGQGGYSGGFVEHYLWPLIYPAGLTRAWQLGLGAGVLLLNVGLYGALLWRIVRRRRRSQRPDSESGR